MKITGVKYQTRWGAQRVRASRTFSLPVSLACQKCKMIIRLSNMACQAMTNCLRWRGGRQAMVGFKQVKKNRPFVASKVVESDVRASHMYFYPAGCHISCKILLCYWHQDFFCWNVCTVTPEFTVVIHQRRQFKLVLPLQSPDSLKAFLLKVEIWRDKV